VALADQLSQRSRSHTLGERLTDAPIACASREQIHPTRAYLKVPARHGVTDEDCTVWDAGYDLVTRHPTASVSTTTLPSDLSVNYQIRQRGTSLA